MKQECDFCDKEAVHHLVHEIRVKRDNPIFDNIDGLSAHSVTNNTCDEHRVAVIKNMESLSKG